MKVLLTGGNGFLGKSVQQVLLHDKIDFVSPTSKELDLLNIDNVKEYVKDFDVILHMAAVCGGIFANKQKPADFLTKNIQMGLNLFEAVKQSNKDFYIYTLGSVCSYPKFCPVPFKEEDLWNGYPEETNAPYGHAKRTLLMLQKTYKEQYGIKGAHLVPVNMFGKHDSFDLNTSHVIPALIRKFIEAKEQNKKEVVVWGSGNATREFVYVEDVAQALANAIKIKLNYDDPINIGIGCDISIRDLSLIISNIIQYDGNIVFDHSKPDGQPKRMLDVSKAKDILGFSAKVSLEDGLKKTIDWYRGSL